MGVCNVRGQGLTHGSIYISPELFRGGYHDKLHKGTTSIIHNCHPSVPHLSPAVMRCCAQVEVGTSAGLQDPALAAGDCSAASGSVHPLPSSLY